jgi:hypothetical protein
MSVGGVLFSIICLKFFYRFTYLFSARFRMMKFLYININKYLQLNIKTGIAISLLFWIYLIVRAYLVPVLSDEAASFWFYIETGNILPFSIPIDRDAANNHVLNSLLSRLFFKLFGYAPVVLRMANLLFVPVYCLFAYKISDTLKNKYLALLFWLCLLFIHSIVEFLALCRGYGMSFALLFGCLWYLINALRFGKTIDYFLSLIFLAGSVMANLSLLASALMISGLLIINVIVLSENIKIKLCKLSIVILTGLLPVYLFSIYSFALQKAGALYYGQHDSFWVQAVNTLTIALFSNQSVLLRLLVCIYFILILILFIIYLGRNISLKLFQNPVMVFPFLLIGNICAVILLNYFFKINFPEDRTGFYFYYFFIGSIFILTGNFSADNKYKRIAWLALPLVLIPLHFVYAFNFTHVTVYKDNRIPYRFYKEIRTKSENMPEVATLGSYRGRLLILAYQNYLYKSNVALIHSSDYPSLVPDFQIVTMKEYASWKLFYNAIDYDQVSGYNLLERKHKLIRHTIAETGAISSNGVTCNEYFSLAEGTIDTLNSNPLFFEYTLDIESPAIPFGVWLVVSTSDSTGKTTAYEYIPLNWFKPVWRGKSKHFHNGQLVTNLPPGKQKYLTYIWNINKVPFSITNARVKVKRLEKDFK